ncbi:L-type lectin-domain containing receptor kinase S.4-like [Amborella trichopoda]|nr:L-type lectin-domain containing receptor kinase S.4-like [Amborella trichopoda]|eukprot:XP_020519829.1 L-type lectin-domain containing receptor kinase S.4-like [Amborella trichopoda]
MVQTLMVLSLAVSLVWFSAAGVISQRDSFVFNGFEPANLSLNGASLVRSNGALQLTNSSLNLIGHSFYHRPLSFRSDTSFSTTFVFAIVPPVPGQGGHGLAFTIAPSPLLPGAQIGQWLGLLNSTTDGNSSNHVFAVEFDTVQGQNGDIDSNHVGIDINSLVSNASESAAYYSGDNQKQAIILDDAVPIQAWVGYRAREKRIDVTIAPFRVDKPHRPLISHTLDLSSVLLPSMYVGFSSATMKLGSAHYILGWSFSLNGEARPLDLSRLPSFPRPGAGSKRAETIMIVASLSGTFLLLAVAVILGAYLIRRAKLSETLEDWERDYPHRFSYKDLYLATKGFKDREVLGSGGFGRVYKGNLPGSGAEVAVKRVSHGSKQGVREFIAEVASLGRLRHRNLVQLQGWCKRNDDLLLVYDYMPNGSLDRLIFHEDDDDDEHEMQQQRTVLGWKERYRILQDIAAALLYLHEEWEQVVVHRDVKASNVLLDSEMNGRLGDFGLSRLYEHGSNPRTTHIVGTLGYLAPELTRTYKATTEADVYAYGALMLEVACGRRPVEPKAAVEEMLLVEWVQELYSEGKIADASDQRLNGWYMKEEMEMVLKLGLLCTHPQPQARPSMRHVWQALGGHALLPLEPRFMCEDLEFKNMSTDSSSILMQTPLESSSDSLRPEGGFDTVHSPLPLLDGKGLSA